MKVEHLILTIMSSMASAAIQSPGQHFYTFSNKRQSINNPTHTLKNKNKTKHTHTRSYRSVRYVYRSKTNQLLLPPPKQTSTTKTSLHLIRLFTTTKPSKKKKICILFLTQVCYTLAYCCHLMHLFMLTKLIITIVVVVVVEIATKWLFRW